MVAIRLRRAGSKKRPFFRIVVADSRGACDSSFVEILGHYNPRTKPAVVKVDAERVQYWLQHGAQPSDSVRTLMARHLTPVPVESAVAAPAKPRRGSGARAHRRCGGCRRTGGRRRLNRQWRRQCRRRAKVRLNERRPGCRRRAGARPDGQTR